MAKFFRLVENEYIKTLKKVSTIIMLVIVVLAGIALPTLSKVVERVAVTNVKDSSRVQDQLNNYQDNISYLKDSKQEGWELEVEKKQYLYDNAITLYDGWKYDAVNAYFDAKSVSGISDEMKKQLEPVLAKFKESLDTADFIKYCEAMIENNNITLKEQGYTKEAIETYNWEYQYRMDNNIIPSQDIFAVDPIKSFAGVKTQLYEIDHNVSGGASDLSEKEISELRDEAVKYQYMIDNGIETNVADVSDWFKGEGFTFWSVFKANIKTITVVGLLMILIAGGIVSNEFTSGTIKFLLINPAKRWKILMAKYFTAVTLGYIMVILLYGISLVTSGILYGFDGGNASYITLSNGAVTASNPYLHIFCDFLLSGVSTVVMATLSFAISSIVRSTALSVGIGLFTYLAGSTINAIIAELGFGWGKYLIFANLNLPNIISGNSYYLDHSIWVALAVIGVHLFVFLLSAWDGFTKREI